MIKLLLRASLVLLVFHVSFIDSLPQLGSLVRGSSGFLSDIVRSMKSEDLSQIMIKTGELLIILGKSSLIKPDNAGDYVEYALSNFNA
ncbi:uncharacterized protein [Lepeophtheirus salmonis]|uniref:uncharacterized protein isoform X2 n=1 Tax=Lepeophtheirus salmonis TaxID=72036 RepID=UPI003AF381CD